MKMDVIQRVEAATSPFASEHGSVKNAEVKSDDAGPNNKRTRWTLPRSPT